MAILCIRLGEAKRPAEDMVRQWTRSIELSPSKAKQIGVLGSNMLKLRGIPILVRDIAGTEGDECDSSS